MIGYSQTSPLRRPEQLASIRKMSLTTRRWASQASNPVLYQINSKLLSSITRQESSMAGSGMWSRVMPSHAGVGSDPMGRLQ